MLSRLFGYLKHHRLRIGLGLGVVLVFVLHALGVWRLAVIDRIEAYSYDLRLQWTMPDTQDKRIVIVDIDEKSLQALGHWPWSRNKLAQLVTQLFEHYQIDTLGFDIVFAEADDSSGLPTLTQLGRTQLRDDARFTQALEALAPALDYDQVFADSLKNRRVALGYYFRHEDDRTASKGLLPPPLLPAGSFDPEALGAVVAGAYTANLPALQHNAPAGGFFNVSPLVDADGVVRRISLLQQHDGAVYETLALAMARLTLGVPRIGLNYADGQLDALALESIQLGARRIPVDIDVAAPVPYRGHMGSFPYVAAVDVLQGKVPAELLRGALVLVGTTAPGLMDLRTTPVQEVYPGVEVHANLLAGILDGTIHERPAYTLGLELALLALVGLLLALLLPALSPLGSTLLCAATAAGWLGANLGAWTQAGLILPLAALLLLMASLYVFSMAYGFFIESRGKRQLTGLFGQYVPPELVNEMAKDPGAYTLAGESRRLTVLFADVRGFTTISEGLEPRQLTQLMNEFLSPMTRVIHQHRGTIDKYMGDAIMAFWGAPLEDPEHARHGVQAALEMISQLAALQDHFKAQGWPPVRIGVGLSTGPMTVGNMGSQFRMAYTVMGDAVNLGSRLEALTRVYGVDIIVSEVTRADAADFVYRELDSVRVKGKLKPVVIFEPIGVAGSIGPERQQALARWAQALAAYRAQDWQAAADLLSVLARAEPDCALYRMYAERVATLREHPPGADWDGVYTFTLK